MADTKISLLTAVVTPAGTDQYATNQGGTSKSTLLSQIMTFVNTAPIWAAGTASAGTWPTFTSGTLLTSQVSGTWEYDGSGLYFSVKGNRGIVQAPSLITMTAAFVTAGGTTSLQKLFNSSTNGAITVQAGVSYEFECLINLTAMSASSGTFSFGFGGTATYTNLTYTWLAEKATGAASTSASSGVSITGGATVLVAAANTATAGYALIKGRLTVNAGGTIIPSFATSVAAATSVERNSYFKLTPMGPSTTVGNWS